MNKYANKQPLVSVLLCIYNVDKYLSECLDSILSQSYKNLEIICVNNGSTDTCGNILEQYAQTDPRIKVISLEKNVKLCSGRNTGMDHATGKYICFIDPDDWIEKDNIKAMVEAIENHKDPDGHAYNLVINFAALNFCNNTPNYYFERPSGSCNQPLSIDDYNHNIHNETHIPMWNRLYNHQFVKETGIRFIDGFQTDNIPFTLKLMCHMPYWYTIDRTTLPNINYWRRMEQPTGQLTNEVLYNNYEIPACLNNLYDYLVEHHQEQKIKVPFSSLFKLCFPRHSDKPKYYADFKNLMQKMENSIKTSGLYTQDEINLCNLILYTSTPYDFMAHYFPSKIQSIQSSSTRQSINKINYCIKLFSIIPIWSVKGEKDKKVIYKLCGLPLIKLKISPKTTKAYLFGILNIYKKINKLIK